MSEAEVTKQELYDAIIAVYNDNRTTIFSSGWELQFIRMLLCVVGEVIETITPR